MHSNGRFHRILNLFRMSLGVILGNRKLLLCSVATTGAAFALIVLMVTAPLISPAIQFWQQVQSKPQTASNVGIRNLRAEAQEENRKISATVSSDHATAYVELDFSDFSSWQALAYIAAGYLLIGFFWSFANVALSHEVLKALNGDEVSIRRGLRFAVGRMRSIFVWSLFAGSIGVLLHLLQPHIKWIGRTLLGSIELMWSVATAFIVPVLIREKTSNPIALVKTSSTTVRNTWGESLAGYWGYTVIAVLGCIPGFSLVFLAMVPAVLGWSATWSWALPIAGLGALGIIGGSIVLFEAAWQVYCCSLYVYATEGVIPAPFSQEQMDEAWTVRRSE